MQRTAPSLATRMLRGALLLMIGGVAGATAMYVGLGAQASTRNVPVAATVAPAAVDPANPPAQPTGTLPHVLEPTPDAPAGQFETPAPATQPQAPVPPLPAPGTLAIPVQGVAATQLTDTFTDARSGGRVHDAIDIMAPTGTPVIAADDGRVVKLFNSKLGGTTLYQAAPDGDTIYYYAHLNDYAPGIVEGMAVKRGQLLGHVGFSGNANPAAPHLHFAVMRMDAERKWWKGSAINPYPLLTGKPGAITAQPAAPSTAPLPSGVRP